MARLFGTDGVRGIANQAPLTPELAFQLGRVGGAFLREKRGASARGAIIVGRDTRLSGPMLEAALSAGVCAAGADCVSVGVMPTPAIAFLTRALGADGGVVISASHNPYEDNGIKFFAPTGMKLPDEWEEEMESRLPFLESLPRPVGAKVGGVLSHPGAGAAYQAFAIGTVPGVRLEGMRIVVDCAHGATYRVGPRILRSLGAEVVTIGARPTGRNINHRVGALSPESLQRRVTKERAHVGLAFDGDGDRLISVDETGEVRDGDFLLALFARDLARSGRLPGGCVVTTLMANLGLEISLREAGIRMVRTPVGDRYVLEEMLRLGAVLGGEQSGHIIFLDHTTTGDGIISALQLLRLMKEAGQPLSVLAECVRKSPQRLVNVAVRATPPLETLPRLHARIQEIERAMNGRGRVLVRYSGTEPVARVMVEGQDEAVVTAVAEELAALIRAELG